MMHNQDEKMSFKEWFLTSTKQFFLSIIMFIYNVFKMFIKEIFNIIKAIYKFITLFGFKVYLFVKKYVLIFKRGNHKVKMSFLFMGYGSLTNGQKAKGFSLFLMQICYIIFMVLIGGRGLSRLITLGVNQPIAAGFDEETQSYLDGRPGDNSLMFLLVGVLSVMITLLFAYQYFSSINRAYENQKRIENGKRPLSAKEEIKSLVGSKFHVLIFIIPMTLLMVFTILPLVIMILVAFTNFSSSFRYPGSPFSWIGLKNFSDLFFNNQNYVKSLPSTLQWTLIWAIFATFLNYIFGLLLAIIINKKGIKLKKMWRTIFIISIAVPQFISLLSIGKMFGDQGVINELLLKWGLISERIQFLSSGSNAKITVILVNLWVGVPYTMLITSGILMNIPKDLYESAEIDGANALAKFFKITMPYMLFVTGPYLITQFIGNINNFGVIYFLTAGGPLRVGYSSGHTDLLITWLFKLTTGSNPNYGMASAIGIFVFMLSGFISLVLYNNISSNKDEGAFN